MANKKQTNGKSKLIEDLNQGTFAPLYIIYGEEDYMKEFYLNELRKKVTDPNFSDFNIIEYEGRTLTADMLTDAIDSYPAMAEKKLVIIKDFDLYKPPSAFSDLLSDMLADLPDYVCLVFYYDILDGKPDKRTSLYKKIEKLACFAQFDHLEDRELTAWIIRRVRALNKEISPDMASYLLFRCGSSMTNLTGEIEKAAAHATTAEIKKYNIDSVCSRVLESVVFDLTDAITAGNYEKAVALVDDLIAQKNNEIMIFTSITRHLQRLYAAKLCDSVRGGEKMLMEAIGSKSPYYAKQIQAASRKVSLSWLRNSCSLCANTDSELKKSAVNKQKQIEIALLSLASSEKGG